MKYLQICFAWFMILLACAGTASAQQNTGEDYVVMPEGSPTAQELLKWREVLTYKVTYSFFTIGQVKMVMEDTLYQGEPAWRLSGIITSNPGIPFVGREENHYNIIFKIDDGRPKEMVYWKDDVDSEKYNEDRYVYNYDRDKVYAFKEGEAIDTLALEMPATSGPLIYFFSRLRAGQQVNSRLFIYLDEQKGTIDMKYTRQQEKREYEAFEEPVNTFYAEGDADIKGPFGFSGEFKAWFADDALRIPLEAHVKVWLGNAKVRLIDYKKELRNE